MSSQIKKRETRFLSGVENWSATVRRVRLERLKDETTAGREGSQQAAIQNGGQILHIKEPADALNTLSVLL